MGDTNRQTVENPDMPREQEPAFELANGNPVEVADADEECILCHIMDMLEPNRPTIIVQMNAEG